MFSVNGKWWSIVYALPGTLRRSDGSITVGMTDAITQRVYLDCNLYGSFKERVLAHELVHVFMFSYDLEMDLDAEEFMADFFSLYGRDMIYLLDDLLQTVRKPGAGGRA